MFDVKEKVNKARNPLKSRLFRGCADDVAFPGKAIYIFRKDGFRRVDLT